MTLVHIVDPFTSSEVDTVKGMDWRLGVVRHIVSLIVVYGPVNFSRHFGSANCEQRIVLDRDQL